MLLDMRLRGVGTDITVQLHGIDESQGGEILAAWRRCLVGSSWSEEEADRADGGVSVNLLSEAGEIGRLEGDSIDDVHHRMVSLVTLAVIEARRADTLLLHAGGVADPRSGRVAALVGASGAGKTTAIHRLAATHGYVSDETIGVEPRSLAVHPYPKPLSLKVEDRRTKLQAGPDQLGLGPLPAERGLELGAVLLLDRAVEGGPERPMLEPVPLVEALVELVPQISYLSARQRPLEGLLEALGRAGGVRRLSYRNDADLGEVVGDLLAAPPVPVETGHVPAPSASAAVRGIRRLEVQDAVEVEGRLVVLKDERVTVLEGIAPAIWRAADGADLGGIVEAVVAEHGDPAPGGASAEELVRSALGEMAAAGVLLDEDS